MCHDVLPAHFVQIELRKRQFQDEHALEVPSHVWLALSHAHRRRKVRQIVGGSELSAFHLQHARDTEIGVYAQGNPDEFIEHLLQPRAGNSEGRPWRAGRTVHLHMKTVFILIWRLHLKGLRVKGCGILSPASGKATKRNAVDPNVGDNDVQSVGAT